GNMIRTLIKFGYSNDPRVRRAIDWLPKYHLEDGGWNCDHPENKVKHSSFMSTIEPLWAYSEIPRQKWTRKMKRSINDGAEFLLMHHVYKSDNHHWQETYPFFTKLHFPMYYFYDILHALRVLTKLGYGDDERIRSAVQLLLSEGRPGNGYLASPEKPRGGVLVLHAWWGLNDFFKSFANRLASQGFLALAADLHDGALATSVDGAKELQSKIANDRIKQIVLGAADYLRSDPSISGRKIGVVGFSMGAGWSLHLSTLKPETVGAVVVFYGTYPIDFSKAEASFLG